ncbi:MAG: 30S ribosomal protein THX [Saprospiraceae bacterium]|nr:30S ribosomal protein THX [Saprospiraceae bacterium]MBK7810592.1 30S ribosomal protein THX [Saprospiraceae bacterium]MBK9630183.1 30S ribosomal protein THX [Saprospiraceae bacterium]
MGRGDKRTAKGKRTRASYGNSRPKKVKTSGSTKKA